MMELNKVEAVICILGRGSFSERSHDLILAHGLSGIRNPLGNAIDRFEANQNSETYGRVVRLLRIESIKAQVCTRQESKEIAEEAIAYFFGGLCRGCKGTGVMDKHQNICPVCSGTGKVPQFYSDKVRKAMQLLKGSMEWMNSQMRKKGA
jgi:uncharacterized phage protein